MQRKRRNISFRDVGCNNKSNEDIANPTNAAWWTSPKRIPSLRIGAVLRTRSSQVVMAAYGGMTRYPRKVLHTIPYLSLIFLLLLGVVMVNPSVNGRTYALEIDSSENEEEEVSTSENELNEEYGISTHTATASLTIDNNTVSSDGNTTITDTVTIAPGTVGYSKEHTIEVSVSDISDYTLTISGPTNLTGPNGATTAITGAGGKAGNSMADNTWGYGFGSTSTAKESLIYNTLSTTGTNLATIDTTLPTVGSNDGSGNGSNITFSRKLVFAAKFGATNTNSGKYTAKVTLSLVATPKTATDLSSITYMQELDGHPEICTNTPLLSGKTYSDVYTLTDNRTYPDGVSKTYTVRKFADGGGENSGRCWMTQNLKIYNTEIKAADSDFEGEDITLRNSTLADFTSANKEIYRSYYNTDQTTSAKVNTTSYYNWYTATAGAGNSSVSTGGTSVNTSICPKGWTLPTGGSNSSTSDFGKFASAAGIGNNSTGSDTIRYNIYNFLYTGSVNNGSLGNGTSGGYWWSSTAGAASSAYALYVSSSNVTPGTYNNLNNSNRHFGYAVRCIARN